KLEGNRPFAEQNKIKENQKYYESLVLQSPYNVNDWLNIHPGDENLGPYGEFLTIKQIVRACGETQSFYKILNNIYLHSSDVTTEVDIVLIHETGVYVFESKNYAGFIFGSAEQKEWTQSLNPREKHRFYNPLWQNRGHIAALKRVLGQNLQYYSFIVFSERCQLKKVPPDNASTFILRRHNLRDSLVKKLCTTSTALSIDQIEQLYQKLVPFSNVSEAEKESHIQRVNGKKN
ncbi:MAG: NERD domain-containing protein, partial [Fibrobacter sp.]|nr:NERD domain-containing protein [Fibrobacter sp.]